MQIYLIISLILTSFAPWLFERPKTFAFLSKTFENAEIEHHYEQNSSRPYPFEAWRSGSLCIGSFTLAGGSLMLWLKCQTDPSPNCVRLLCGYAADISFDHNTNELASSAISLVTRRVMLYTTSLNFATMVNVSYQLHRDLSIRTNDIQIH